MNHFEEAQARLSVWISADAARHHDWLRLFEGKTVAEHCSQYAYKQDIIGSIVRQLMEQETIRTIQRINGSDIRY